MKHLAHQYHWRLLFVGIFVFVESNRRIVIMFLSMLCSRLKEVNGMKNTPIIKIKTKQYSESLHPWLDRNVSCFDEKSHICCGCGKPQYRNIRVGRICSSLDKLILYIFSPILLLQHKESIFMLLLTHIENGPQNIRTAKNTIFIIAFC